MLQRFVLFSFIYAHFGNRVLQIFNTTYKLHIVEFDLLILVAVLEWQIVRIKHHCHLTFLIKSRVKHINTIRL